MRIDSLPLKHFRGFADFTVELHPDCTVFAGVNASGKSSVLDGLAVAAGAWFLGFDDVPPRSIAAAEVRRVRIPREAGHVDLEPQYPVRVEARGHVSDRELTWARELRGAEGKTTYGEASHLRREAVRAQDRVQENLEIDLPVIAYYGTGRLWVQKRASQIKELGLTSRTLGYQDCLDPESNHKLFEAWMKQREIALVQRASRGLGNGQNFEAEDPQLEAVATTAGRFIEGGKRLYFDLASDELRLLREDGTEQSFELLSDGYRNLVALVADVAWRSVRLNPHRGADAPRASSGIVLIDEIELHLHPGWQRTVLNRLRHAFPELQIVVSTHSPQVLAGVEPECVRFLDGERARRVAISEGLDTNTVLRDLMGVPERPPEFAELLGKVASMIDGGDLGPARIELDRLAEKLGQDDPSVTALEWELADARSLAAEVS